MHEHVIKAIWRIQAVSIASLRFIPSQSECFDATSQTCNLTSLRRACDAYEE